MIEEILETYVNQRISEYNKERKNQFLFMLKIMKAGAESEAAYRGTLLSQTKYLKEKAEATISLLKLGLDGYISKTELVDKLNKKIEELEEQKNREVSTLSLAYHYSNTSEEEYLVWQQVSSFVQNLFDESVSEQMLWQLFRENKNEVLLWLSKHIPFKMLSNGDMYI